MQEALFGVSSNFPDTPCNPKATDTCREPVQMSSPDYYQEILEHCDGRRDCNNLRADRVAWPCEGTGGFASDYMAIGYICVEGEITV